MMSPKNALCYWAVSLKKLNKVNKALQKVYCQHTKTVIKPSQIIILGEIVIDSATVQHLLIAADMLQLRELVSCCGEFLRRELHPSNALGIFR